MKVRNRTPGRTGSRFGRLRSCGGFTLTELIVVMVMVGVLAATVGMKSGWLTSGTNLRRAIDQVAGDLRFIQCRTMAVYSGTAVPTLRSVTFPAGGTTYNLGGQVKSLPSGVTMSISPGLTVTFNSLGEYQATANTNLVLKSGSLTGGITIYAISGNVEAY
jgi:prepilin-type N-terminal cleavage/methylation domain-containing protein